MIRGRITATDQAVLELAVFGPTGRHRTLQVLMDTGFNGYLTLTPRAIAELQLDFYDVTAATIAGATTMTARRYWGEVAWHGMPREIVVLEAEGVPLLGMSMLRGHRVSFDAVIDGGLTIVPIPESA